MILTNYGEMIYRKKNAELKRLYRITVLFSSALLFFDTMIFIVYFLMLRCYFEVVNYRSGLL